MPFLTRNPSYYLAALQEGSTDPLHIGLYLGGGDQQVPGQGRGGVEGGGVEESMELATTDEIKSWTELASAIRETSRSIRCLWLRVAKNDDESSDDTASVLSAMRTLGHGLVGTTVVENVAFEDQGMAMDQLLCLREYLAGDTTIRGIKFLRTNLDAPSSLLLNDFLEGNSSLRVVDLTDNPRVDDKTVRVMLDAITRNRGCRLETLNIFEKLEGDAATIGITGESGVNSIASFVAQTPTLSILRLRIRELGDTGVQKLANLIKSEDCKITRLEICGRFGDEGVRCIAEALATNQSIRTIDIGMADGLTDFGGQALLDAVQGKDESWKSKIESNHTVQHVYISDRAGLAMNKGLRSKLQSITTVNPHQTIRNKAWEYIETKVEDLSAIDVDLELAPYLLSFISSRGGVNSLFRFLHSRSNLPELFSLPTPERVRCLTEMERVQQRNKSLRALLRNEREISQSIRTENIQLRDIENDNEHQRKAVARCLLLPICKTVEICKFLMEMLKE